MRSGLAFVAISFALGVPALGAESERKANAVNFLRLLREGNVSRAERFVPYFSGSETSAPELIAQYELQSCRPRSAWAAAEKIADPDKKKLFQAVILALSSVKRPLPPVAETERKKAAPSTKLATRTEPLHPTEIWRDEWKGIQLSANGCAEFPVLENPDLAEKNRVRAAELFSSLPEKHFLGDFAVVALALDVGAALPSSDKILLAHANRAGDAYHLRLLAKVQDTLSLTQASADRREVSAQKTGDSQFTLSPLTLRATTASPQRVPIPMIASPEDLR